MFIYFRLRFYEKKCDIPFTMKNSNFYYEIFMLEKRGVTLTENGKALDERLSDFRNQLDKLTSEFVI